MSDETRSKARQTQSDIDALWKAEPPEPTGRLVSLDQASPEEQAEIGKHLAELDMRDTQSIISFGSKAQGELQAISQQMLQGVRNKDTGPAGGALREMVGQIRGFSVDELDPNRQRSWWEKLVGKAQPMAEFVARYEDVRGQIDDITDTLLQHEHQLLKDIKSLDLLYEKTLNFYDALAFYIAAGQEKLRRLDETDIPALRAEVEAAPEDEAVLKAQTLRDLRSARDDLERRVHDLKLTRQVTMQSLPSIRLVQENDKSLVTRINSTLVNTVPLWETQLAQSITIHRSREAAGAVGAATDLTNDLLKANAANLKQANAEIRKQVERGVFDIEAVKQANADLIETIEESLSIADEGKARRAAAEKDLIAMETELKNALAAASARRDSPGA